MKNNFNKRLEIYANSLKKNKKDYGSLWNSMIKSFEIDNGSALGQFRGYFPVKNYSFMWIILKPLMTFNYLIRKTFFYLADFNKKIMDYLSNLFIKTFKLNYSKFDIYDLRYIKAKSFLKSQKLKSDLYNVFDLKNNFVTNMINCFISLLSVIFSIAMRSIGYIAPRDNFPKAFK